MSEAIAQLPPQTSLSPSGRLLVLIVAFLGWMCAGMHMSTTQLAGQDAAIDLLSRDGILDANRYQELNKRALAKPIQGEPSAALSSDELAQLSGWKAIVARWFAWYQCAFLFGAATGGLVFGWLGDRFGRSKGMAFSILTYSGFAGVAYFAQTPLQLLVIWFVACTGVGGIWPNGVALIAEAWTGMSRAMSAGVIGTAANVGLFLMATLAAEFKITADDWRWVMIVGAAPLALGLFSLAFVPESPRWLATRREQVAEQVAAPAIGEVFRPPLLGVTLLGIAIATVPLIGGWGSANWMVPWAGEVNAVLKAQVGQARALTGIVGSLLGGWFASMLGRRRSFFLNSLCCLVAAQFTFWQLVPSDASFLYWVGALGFFSGIYFGWMPLFLPELFSTRVRSTGAGVCFNFGRFVTAVTIFTSGALMHLFHGDYARIGRVTSLIFALGMAIIWLAPDTSQKSLAD